MAGNPRNHRSSCLYFIICVIVIVHIIALGVFTVIQGFQLSEPSSQLLDHPDIARTPLSNNPPVAIVSPSEAQVQVGEKLVLSGTLSYDEDGEIIQHRWSFSSGNSIYMPQITVQFSSPGLRTVVLTVMDDRGELDFAVATIEVIQTPPQPVLFLSAGPNNIFEIASGTEVVVELQLIAYNEPVANLNINILADNNVEVQVQRIPDEVYPNQITTLSLNVRVPEDVNGPIGTTVLIQVEGHQIASNVERLEIIVPGQSNSPVVLWELLETLIIVVVAIMTCVMIKWRWRG